MRIVILFMVAGCLLSTNLFADHQRYNVRGYALDAAERSIDKLTVQVLREGSSLGATQTDADGYYSLHIRLHDADSNRVLKIRAGRHEADLQVKFDAGDARSVLIHEANFIGGKLVEGAIARFRIPSWSYAVGGLLLIFVIVAMLEKRRKKKIRAAKYGPTGNHSPSKHKAKKVKRKHH
jgi:hypothetical protein